MKKSKNGKGKGSAVTSVGQIPLVIGEALALINEAINDPQNGFDSIQVPLSEAARKLDSVMLFIFGEPCDLGKLALTDGQREYLRYIFESFTKGEEIAAINVAPTIVSTL